MITRYKHIIWDWNGTLLNDIVLCLQVLNRILNRRGKQPVTQKDYRRNFGFPVIHFYAYLGLATDKDNFEKISREFIDDYETLWLEQCNLHHEAQAVLNRLSASGVTHSVLSAAKQDTLELGIKHFGINDHFQGLSGASNIYAEGKITQGRRWVEKLNQNPDEIVLIGDTLHDYEVAQAIGTDCILIAHGHHDYKRLAETDVPVLHSLAEIIQPR